MWWLFFLVLQLPFPPFYPTQMYSLDEMAAAVTVGFRGVVLIQTYDLHLV